MDDAGRASTDELEELKTINEKDWWWLIGRIIFHCFFRNFFNGTIQRKEREKRAKICARKKNLERMCYVTNYLGTKRWLKNFITNRIVSTWTWLLPNPFAFSFFGKKSDSLSTYTRRLGATNLDIFDIASING